MTSLLQKCILLICKKGGYNMIKMNWAITDDLAGVGLKRI